VADRARASFVSIDVTVTSAGRGARLSRVNLTWAAAREHRRSSLAAMPWLADPKDEWAQRTARYSPRSDRTGSSLVAVCAGT